MKNTQHRAGKVPHVGRGLRLGILFSDSHVHACSLAVAGLLLQLCECALEMRYSHGPGVLVCMSFDRSSDGLSGPLFLVRLIPAGKGMSVVVLKGHRLYRYRRSDGCSCMMHYSVGCPTVLACCDPFGYPIRGLWRHGLRCVFGLPARA